MNQKEDNHIIPKHIAKHLAPKMDDQRRFLPEFIQWIEFPSHNRLRFKVRIFEAGENIGDQNNLQFRNEIEIGTFNKIEGRVIRPVETEKNTGNKPAEIGNIMIEKGKDNIMKRIEITTALSVLVENDFDTSDGDALHDEIMDLLFATDYSFGNDKREVYDVETDTLLEAYDWFNEKL